MLFIDVIFRFSPLSLCVRASPFPVAPHVAAPKLTPDSTEALFWLDDLQMQIPCSRPRSYMTSPDGTDLVSLREAWHPRVNGGGGWDTWNPPVICGPGSMCFPQLSVTFLPQLACPSPHCLSVWLLVLSFCCLSHPLSLYYLLTDDSVTAPGSLRSYLLRLTWLHLHVITRFSGN